MPACRASYKLLSTHFIINFGTLYEASTARQSDVHIHLTTPESKYGRFASIDRLKISTKYPCEGAWPHISSDKYSGHFSISSAKITGMFIFLCRIDLLTNPSHCISFSCHRAQCIFRIVFEYAIGPWPFAAASFIFSTRWRHTPALFESTQGSREKMSGSLAASWVKNALLVVVKLKGFS
jgi:hypothetical protein